MLKIKWVEEGERSRYAVTKWEQEGICHGFCSRFVDVSGGSAEFENAFSGSLELRLLKQVHGADYVEVCCSETTQQAGDDAGSLPSADAWIVERREQQQAPREAFGICSADCLPVLLLDSERRFAAALHCGWRSSVGGLLPEVLDRMKQLGVCPSGIEVAIGPGARGCCYEVGEELVSQIPEKLIQNAAEDKAVFRHDQGKIYLELGNLLLVQAVSRGVLEEHVVLTKTCTICDHRFFSHRREKSFAGRQVSFIC